MLLVYQDSIWYKERLAYVLSKREVQFQHSSLLDKACSRLYFCCTSANVHTKNLHYFYTFSAQCCCVHCALQNFEMQLLGICRKGRRGSGSDSGYGWGHSMQQYIHIPQYTWALDLGQPGSSSPGYPQISEFTI